MSYRVLLTFLILAAPVLCASLTGSGGESDDAEATVKDAEDEAAEGNKRPGLLKSFLFGSNLGVNLEADKVSDHCPDICIQVFSPVCGTDGKTYSNKCKLEVYACKSGSGVTVAHEGECQSGDKGIKRSASRYRRDLVVERAAEESVKPAIQESSSESKADAAQAESPTSRHLRPHEIYPDHYSNGHPENLWSQPNFYEYTSNQPHFYDDLYWLQGYGYPYGGPVSPYDYGSSDYCPPCNCKDSHEDDDHEDDEENEEEEEEYHDDEELYNHRNDDYGYPESDVYHPEHGYSSFDPTLRYEYDLLRGKVAVSDESSSTAASERRSKRSVEPFDWYSTGTPSRFLEKHNVGYRIKNHLREKLRNEYFPLHYGHIRLGSGSRGKKNRFFGDYADFDVKSEATAFSFPPKGPKLGKKWIKQGYPVYGYNLYQLLEPIRGKLVDKAFVTSLVDGPDVKIHPGLYRMVMILNDAPSLIIESVRDRQRYLLKNVILDGKTLRKFQAVASWIDKGAKFFQVDVTNLGLAYLIRPSPLGGANPKIQKHRGSTKPKFDHLRFRPSLLKPEIEVQNIKLQPKPSTATTSPPLESD